MSAQCAGASGDGRDVARRRHQEAPMQDYPEESGSILVRQMMQTQLQFSPELLQALSQRLDLGGLADVEEIQHGLRHIASTLSVRTEGLGEATRQLYDEMKRLYDWSQNTDANHATSSNALRALQDDFQKLLRKVQEYEESTVTALQRLDRRAAGTEHALDMHQEARRLDDEENRSKFGQLASRLQVLEEKEANGLGRGDDSVSQPLSDSRERALTGFVEREVDRVRAMLESRSVTDTKVYDALKQDIQSMSEKYNRTLSITVALEARCRDLEVALQQAPKVSGHTPVVTPRSTVFAPGDDQGKVEPGETPELKTPSWGSADELTAPRTPRRSLFNAPVAQEMTPDAVEKSSRWDLHSFQGMQRISGTRRKCDCAYGR